VATYGRASSYGQPLGRPVPHGQPQQYGRAPQPSYYGRPAHLGQAYGQSVPSGPALSPGQSSQSYQPPEQFAHPQHDRGGAVRPQPLPVPPSPHWTGEAWQLAGFGSRAISFLIDLVAPLTILVLLLMLGVTVDSSVLIVALATIGYFGLFVFVLWNSCYRQGTTGQTVGRRVAGTKLVKIETGEPAGFGTALVRQICHGVEFGIGYLWPLWDVQRQTFADKIAGTLVVRVDR
jgi:uncharacterized RDD family membrane protein YckC